MPKIPSLEAKKKSQTTVGGNINIVSSDVEYNRTIQRVDSLKPFWSTSDGETIVLYQGNVIDVLRKMKKKSVQMIVTSPPYWALRDYGTGVWEGGNDPDCKHEIRNKFATFDRLHSPEGHNPVTGWTVRDATRPAHYVCPLCEAVRVDDNQLGSEDTPDKFVSNMVEVFAAAKEVLRDDGTLWLNLGDTYTDKSFPIWKPVGTLQEVIERQKNSPQEFPCRIVKDKYGRDIVETAVTLPKGNLVGIPWRVALALQDDGWIFRQDIIWAKPTPMPEAVTNRCTKSHEHLFLFSKADNGYFYDANAIAEALVGQEEEESGLTKNKRDVWVITSQGYEGTHFATFPPKLVEPPILAGTSEHGCCVQCGSPWKRITARLQLKRERPNEYVKRTGEEGTGNSCPNTVAGVETKTLGWYPTCGCNGLDEIPSEPSTKESLTLHEMYQHQASGLCEQAAALEVKPCTVLDLFIGSGTTCCVAAAHGRNSIGIDLSEAYLRDKAIPRITGELSSRKALAHLTGHTAERASFGESASS